MSCNQEHTTTRHRIERMDILTVSEAIAARSEGWLFAGDPALSVEVSYPECDCRRTYFFEGAEAQAIYKGTGTPPTLERIVEAFASGNPVSGLMSLAIRRCRFAAEGPVEPRRPVGNRTQAWATFGYEVPGMSDEEWNRRSSPAVAGACN